MNSPSCNLKIPRKWVSVKAILQGSKLCHSSNNPLTASPGLGINFRILRLRPRGIEYSQLCQLMPLQFPPHHTSPYLVLSPEPVRLSIIHLHMVGSYHNPPISFSCVNDTSFNCTLYEPWSIFQATSTPTTSFSKAILLCHYLKSLEVFWQYIIPWSYINALQDYIDVSISINTYFSWTTTMPVSAILLTVERLEPWEHPFTHY